MSQDSSFSEHEIHEVLHIIRNPAGWSEAQVRNARLKAADIIEWLQRGRYERMRQTLANPFGLKQQTANH